METKTVQFSEDDKVSFIDKHGNVCTGKFCNLAKNEKYAEIWYGFGRVKILVSKLTKELS